MKIQTKLISTFMVLAFITILAIIVTVYFTVLSNFERLQGEHLKDNVSQAAITIDEFMFTRVKDLNAFSNSPIFSAGNINDIEIHLSEIVKAYPFYDVVSYTDIEGSILASSDESMTGQNILINEPDIKEEFLKTISGGNQDVYISDIAEISQKELDANEPLDIELLSDVVDKSGAKIGVLVGFVNTVFIKDFVLDIDERTIGNEYAYLVNDPGDIVITADSNAVILEPHPDLEIGDLKQKLEGDEHGYMVYVNSKGRKVLSAYADLSEYGTEGVGDWSLLSTAPYDDIMAPVYSLLYNIIVVFVIIFAITILAIIFLSRTLTKPIQKLSAATLGIGEGNLDLLVDVGSKDEIGQLTVSFNKMMHNLQKANSALLQSEKLKSMGTITAGISHEFNNILSIISGNVQLLQKNHRDNKELMDRFCTIMESVDDGVNITDRMREFTHSDRDAANVDFVCSDINELIIQSVKFTMPRWKTMAQVESIDYQIDTGSINGVSPILCDPIGIREVFINIINNALDAMPEGGKIAFCTRNNEGTVFISISDTGKGMTEEVRKEVFDPFFTTRRPMGTGLGLSMAYKTVMMHGGRISVESEVGKGSTFTLQFPLTTKTVDVPSKEKIPEPLTKDLSLNILVVDDEEAICKIMDSVLSEQGHKVKTVNNGTEAIDLSKNEHFDLVLCDLVMPKVSGYEVVKALHKLKKVPKIGIITGWGDLNFTEEDGKRVDFIIRKPIDFSILSKHINDVIGTA